MVGVPCSFPFLYNNIAHWECTNVGSRGFWCGTKHHYSPETWGYCSDKCPMEKSKLIFCTKLIIISSNHNIQMPIKILYWRANFQCK